LTNEFFIEYLELRDSRNENDATEKRLENLHEEQLKSLNEYKEKVRIFRKKDCFESVFP